MRGVDPYLRLTIDLSLKSVLKTHTGDVQQEDCFFLSPLNAIKLQIGTLLNPLAGNEKASSFVDGQISSTLSTCQQRRNRPTQGSGIHARLGPVADR